MNVLYALRYLQIVAAVPPLFLAGFAVAVGAAAATLATDSSAVVEALTPVLLLQLFAASSGFQVPARRGYYDLLLTSGSSRWQIAMAHCVSSIVPGLTAWIAVACLEIATSHGARFDSVSPGTCVAFVAGSLIAWSASLSLSRGTAAVAWLLIMTIPALTRFASPIQLLGQHVSRDPVPLGAATMVATLAVAVAWARIVRGDVRLEASQ